MATQVSKNLVVNNDRDDVISELSDNRDIQVRVYTASDYRIVFSGEYADILKITSTNIIMNVKGGTFVFPLKNVLLKIEDKKIVKPILTSEQKSKRLLKKKKTRIARE